MAKFRERPLEDAMREIRGEDEARIVAQWHQELAQQRKEREEAETTMKLMCIWVLCCGGEENCGGVGRLGLPRGEVIADVWSTANWSGVFYQTLVALLICEPLPRQPAFLLRGQNLRVAMEAFRPPSEVDFQTEQPPDSPLSGSE